MKTRTLGRGTTTADVHARPTSPADPQLPPTRRYDLADVDLPPLTAPQQPAGRMPADADMDSIAPAPPITPASPATPSLPAQQPLEHYWIPATIKLPEADAQGFRTHKKLQYVDVPGGTVQIGVDPQTGLYRARRPNELVASGPLLLRDPASQRWHPHDQLAPDSLPLTDARLAAFRTELDFSTAAADGDGLFSHDRKRYVVIRGHAYQTMQDLAASTPEQTVWRIVKSADPVATDSANIYNASRPGETLAITRNATNEWVAATTGLRGGMPRDRALRFTLDELMQRYQPIDQAHRAIQHSSDQYNALFDQVRLHADGTAEKTAAQIKLEVHLLKHVRMQADFVKALIDNRDWLKHLKAGGRYKEELQTFQMEQVDHLNRLMVIMDLRVKPLMDSVTAENCKKAIVHLNKKLKLLEDREAVVERIKKADPGSAFELDEANNRFPGSDQVNYNKLTLYLRLLTDNSPNPPDPGMEALRAIDLFIGSLKNVPENQQPLALVLAVDQIKAEKSRFQSLTTSQPPEKAGYINEIIALIEPFEKRIESRLNKIYDSFERNTELPHLDQEVDFDFVPPQQVNTPAAPPAAPRKMFRTRQNGTYKVLVGETEVAADGEITLSVPDPFRPESPPQRYEKRQGEWRPVRPQMTETSWPQLINDANRLLASVAGHLAEARAKEARKTNPTDILEYLGNEADLLNDQARLLEGHENSAEDLEMAQLSQRLRVAGASLTDEGQNVLLRMYKNREVLDVLRLNYLLDHDQLKAIRSVIRKPTGKGAKKSFIDVYSIIDRADDAPLWEAHFHYDRADSHALNFTVKGGHLKTLEQAGRGASSQRRDELAGLPHIAIWRETLDGKTAQKIFDLAQ